MWRRASPITCERLGQGSNQGEMLLVLVWCNGIRTLSRSIKAANVVFLNRIIFSIVNLRINPHTQSYLHLFFLLFNSQFSY